SFSGKLSLRGRPAVGGHVYVGRADDRNSMGCYVNEQGDYQIEGLAAGPYELRASFPATRSIGITRRIVLADGEHRKEDFDAGTTTIRGVALDADTQQPIPRENSVTLIARRVDIDGASEEVWSSTVEQGQFEIVLPGPGIYEIRPG